ncbi:MAG TPA: HD domain-containing phosphohydrolase [Solirubrobacteraceae bacterium]|nr:HD domain-containing phosphohydrolase [Solirubrobacteraceae bacterium]
MIDGSPVRTQERAAGPNKDLDPPASVVSDYFASAPGRHLPQMLLATTVVAVLPLVISLGLRASGLVDGWVSVGLAVVMSLASSTAGSAYWRKRGRNTEVLFGELLLWGWIRSRRQERELANATRLLALVNSGTGQPARPDELTVEQHEHLLQQLAGALEGQDVYLNGHSRRVARHATMIARGMALPSEEVARIRAAAAVHDVGKLRTPKAILNKPGRLTDEEYEVIKRHPVDGAAMVAALGDPELTRIVRHHHERLDGAGYPDRLQGEEIPLGARIIAVADTFDAITSARPYREAAPHQKAINILRKEAGTQLDPDAVRSFLAYYSGSRPTALWAIITSSLRRVVSWLSGDPAAAATISASKVAAATAATAAIGAAAGAAPVPVVHHTPARPAVSHAHSVPARPRGAATILGRHGASVLVPVTPPAKTTTTSKASAAKARRKNAHATTARRAHTQPSAARHANRRAPHAGTHSQTAAGSTPTGTPPSTPATHSQSAVTPSTPAAAPSTSQPAATAPASHSQGSNANGNAYGHTKLLGNGHGQGLAKGHGDSSPAPSSPAAPSSSTSPAPSAPAQSNGGATSSHGNDHANGNSNDNGHTNGHADTSSTASVIVPPAAIPAPPAVPAPSNASVPVLQGDQGNGGGNGNGRDHTNGHGG